MGPPSSRHDPVFLNADQIVQEIFRVSVPVNLLRFDIGQTITGTSEGAKEGDIPRVRSGEQIANPRSYDLIRAVIPVHLRRRVVAFSQVTKPVQHLDLLILRQRNRDRSFEFEAPDRFGTMLNESAVTLLALYLA